MSYPPVESINLSQERHALHEVDDALEQELWRDRVATINADPVAAPVVHGDSVYHLVQDREIIEEIFSKELPPDAYYNELHQYLLKEFPKADVSLIEHLVPLVGAFDTATAFALNFCIAKFQLC